MPERRLTLGLSVDTRRVVCGERLPAEVEIHNPGPESVTVSIGPGNPIVFEFASLDRPGVVHRRSRLIALQQALGDRIKPLPPDRLITLDAGVRHTEDEDPARGSTEPLPAGRYRLRAGLTLDGRAAWTEGIEIVVDAPAARRLVSLHCPMTGGQAQAFDHRADDGPGRVLLARDTGSLHANASAFARRADVPACDDLGLAVHVDPQLSGRWLGWIAGSSIGAAACLELDTPLAPDPSPLAMSNPRFVEPLFQRRAATPTHPIFDCGEAWMLVAGEIDGKTHVQSWIATADAITAGPAVALGAAAPQRVLARLSVASGTVLLVWVESAPGHHRVVARSYSRDLQSAGDARTLLDSPTPLLGIEMTPIDLGDDPGDVHVLIGPLDSETASSPAQLAYIRIPLGDDGEGVAERRLLVVPDEAVQAYALAGEAAGDRPVLAQTGETLRYAASTTGGPWRTLAAGMPELRLLRLATAPNGYWAALGIDPQRGVVCLRDPGFSHER